MELNFKQLQFIAGPYLERFPAATISLRESHVNISLARKNSREYIRDIRIWVINQDALITAPVTRGSLEQTLLHFMTRLSDQDAELVQEIEDERLLYRNTKLRAVLQTIVHR